MSQPPSILIGFYFAEAGISLTWIMQTVSAYGPLTDIPFIEPNVRFRGVSRKSGLRCEMFAYDPTRTLKVQPSQRRYRLDCSKTDKHLAVPDLDIVFPYDEAHAKTGMLTE